MERTYFKRLCLFSAALPLFLYLFMFSGCTPYPGRNEPTEKFGDLKYVNTYSNEEGTGGRGLAVSPDGKSLYQACEYSDSIEFFSRDGSSGAITHIGRYSDTAIERPYDIIVSDDGRYAYAGSFYADAVAWFSRDEITGMLTFIDLYSSSTNINSVYSLCISPDGNHLYAVASNGNTIAWFKRNKSTGALEYEGRYTNVIIDSPLNVAISADGNHAYAGSYYGGPVTWFTRNTSTGALTFGGQFTGPEANASCAVFLSPDDKYCYAVSCANLYCGFSRNATDGSLAYLDCDGTVTGTEGVHGTISPDGRNIYVHNTADTIGCYTLNSSTGLAALRGIYTGEGCNGLQNVKVSPDGKHVYFSRSNGVVLFSRN